MTKQIEQRLKDLEQAVAQLQQKVGGSADPLDPWWLTGAGRFRGDRMFDEIVRLGAEYRRSLKPRRRNKRARSRH